MHKEVAYWLSHVFVAIVGIALFKLAAAKSGVSVLADLAAFI